MRRNKPKSFEMARSILPSTARKHARAEKRELQHRNRTNLRGKLSKYRGYAADIEDIYDDEADDLEHYWTPRFMPGYDTIVSDRREADKLNHFVRWAGEVIKDMDPQEGWDHLRSIVPPGIIGDHALTHLYMYNPEEHKWWNRPGRTDYAEYEQRRKKAWGDFLNEVYTKLRETAKDDRKRRKFNKALAAQFVNRYSYREYRDEFGIRHVEATRQPATHEEAINGYHDLRRFWEMCGGGRRRGYWAHLQYQNAYFKFVLDYFHMEYVAPER